MTMQDLFCFPSHVTLTHSETFSSHAHGARCRTDSESLLLWWGSRRFIVLSLEGNPPSVPVIDVTAACVYTSLVLAALLLCSFLIYYYFRCLCLLSGPLVYLGPCIFFFFFSLADTKGLIKANMRSSTCAGHAAGTQAEKLPLGLNSGVYSIQDLLSTVSLLCWYSFLEPEQQSVF